MSKQESLVVKLEDFQTTVLAAATEKYPRNMGGDLIRLQDGRLFLSYSQWLTGVTDADSSRLVGRISKDDGESWGDVFIVAEPNEHCDSVRMPSLIRLGDGRLALFTRFHQTMSRKWVAMMVCKDESLEMINAPVWTKLKRVSPPDTGAQVIISKRVVRTKPGENYSACCCPLALGQER